jgi:hypothetical protein
MTNTSGVQRRLTLASVRLSSEVVQLAKAAMDAHNVRVVAGEMNIAPQDHSFGYLTLKHVRLRSVAFTTSDSINLLGANVEGTLHITFEEVERP